MAIKQYTDTQSKAEQVNTYQLQTKRGTNLGGTIIQLPGGGNFRLEGATAAGQRVTTPAPATTVPTSTATAPTTPVVTAPATSVPTPAAPTTTVPTTPYTATGFTREADTMSTILPPTYDTSSGKVLNTGLSDPNYVPKTREEIFEDPNLTPETKRRWYANYLQSQGLSINPEDYPSTGFDEMQLFFDTQKNKKDALDYQIDSQISQAKRQLETNTSAVSSQIGGVNREGLTSVSNQKAAQDINQEFSVRTNNAVKQLEDQKRALADLQKLQNIEYLDSRADQINQTMANIAKLNAEAAKAAQEQFQNSIDVINAFKDNPALGFLTPEQQGMIQGNLPQFPGLINALATGAQQTYYDKKIQTQLDNQLKAITNFKNLTDSGIEIPFAMATSIARDTGLPVEAIMNFNAVARSIMEDKKLTAEEKAINLDKARLELDNLAKGITTAEAQKFEYLKNMYKNGEDPASIAMFKRIAGIQDADDPMYIADLMKKGLENQALAIGLQYLDQDKQLEILTKITDLDTKKTLLSFLPQEKQVELALKNTELDIQGILRNYLPYEKDANLKKIEQDLRKGDIELEWLPAEKQVLVDKALQEITTMAINNQFLPAEKTQGLNIGEYDLMIKAAEAAGADVRVIAELEKIKAEATKLNAETADLTGQAITPANYKLGSIGVKYMGEGSGGEIQGLGEAGINIPPGFSKPKVGGWRTDRNNNPTAFTTDVAKTLGLIKGVDYVVGDKFPGKSQLYTAKLLGDPMETTIKAFDQAASRSAAEKAQKGGAFKTARGGWRWSYKTPSDEQWLAMTPNQKREAVIDMYRHEGGTGRLAGGSSNIIPENPDYAILKGKVLGLLPSLANKGAAVDELLWLTSAQSGGDTNIITAALGGQNITDMSEAEIINKVQDYKLKLPENAGEAEQNRINSERADLLQLDKSTIKPTKKNKEVDEQYIQSIRKEFMGKPSTEDFRLLKSDYENFLSIKRQYDNNEIDKPTRDLALARLFNQMITQRTMMRENDFTRIGSNQGLLDSANNLAQKAINGGDLDDNQVDALMNTAATLYNYAQKEFIKTGEFYSDEAARLGVDKSRILGEYGGMFNTANNVKAAERSNDDLANSIFNRLINSANAAGNSVLDAAGDYFIPSMQTTTGITTNDI